MTNERRNEPACLLWPFVTLWRLLAGVVSLAGRLALLVLGFALIVIGVVLTITIVGAIIGIPLALVGLLLMVRSIF
jgi:hypothetical protein